MDGHTDVESSANADNHGLLSMSLKRRIAERKAKGVMLDASTSFEGRVRKTSLLRRPSPPRRIQSPGDTYTNKPNEDLLASALLLSQRDLEPLVQNFLNTSNCIEWLPMDSHTLLRKYAGVTVSITPTLIIMIEKFFITSCSLIEFTPTLAMAHYNWKNVQSLERTLRALESRDGEPYLQLDIALVGSGKRVAVTRVLSKSTCPATLYPPSTRHRQLEVDWVHEVFVSLHPEPPGIESIKELLATPSFKGTANGKIWNELHNLIHRPTAKQNLIQEKFKNREDVEFKEFCEWGLRTDCNKHQHSTPCPKLHFRRIIKPQTDVSLGDCSYLNTCHRLDQCKYVHYELDEVNVTIDIDRPLPVLQIGNPLPAQWISCDVRKFDLSILGKFTVIMADPPWDIHMNLPYGTMTDDEMKEMPIQDLQDEGFLFLWVTGRAMELGRDCMAIWGYTRIDELIWVKTMQLQKLIRTGRTGHWLNHSKEHCLVGVKGGCHLQTGGIDGDVLVAEVRETSRKPDEIYSLIDRLCPGTRKLEIFGRPHNTRDGWMTLGNQLDGVRICEKAVLERYNKLYPATPATLFVDRMS
ncbi:uncharacterized protein SPPG_03319 [Spizellomyces punctatus DAOM BR117]|uniref:mRNA m(6)A methyltransferase n=1 Tax=Spizellomyces punctatus (strain DAOM BR117) TaxID=645134 RepID=A0A0L0HKU4_SPIPD|nr:uncharacterized protein SPPG_03319 [Spizellomyces punctatus DAOM BR117]KND01520.1 hypothetical protein SPPG_03319 [Spizellomyces punctatus DAOM BR117]|eukprot:XP_016609559.1 hypothetical protein SPPG_03319 [Spizellomyces punctatus DAOM BR117]